MSTPAATFNQIVSDLFPNVLANIVQEYTGFVAYSVIAGGWTIPVTLQREEYALIRYIRSGGSIFYIRWLMLTQHYTSLEDLRNACVTACRFGRPEILPVVLDEIRFVLEEKGGHSRAQVARHIDGILPAMLHGACKSLDVPTIECMRNLGANFDTVKPYCSIGGGFHRFTPVRSLLQSICRETDAQCRHFTSGCTHGVAGLRIECVICREKCWECRRIGLEVALFR